MLLRCILLISLFLPTTTYSKDEVTQLELQEDLQRFYTRFTEKVVSALNVPKITKSFSLSKISLRQYLLYDSEALKIVTSPFPEVNLMDMLVFIKLSKASVRDIWIPKLYGASGKDLYRAFRDSERDIDEIALKILSKEDLEGVERTIAAWRRQNPNQVRVEKVRIADFSKLATNVDKQMQEEGKGFSLSNLIVNTSSAVKAVDQMVLVANRAIFLVQQMPFLVRLQARVGTHEIIDDLGVRFSDKKDIQKRLKAIEPLAGKMNQALSQMDELVSSSNQLVKNVKTVIPKGVNINSGMKDLNSSLDKSIYLLNLFRKGEGNRRDMIESFQGEARNFIWFIAFVTILTGASLMIIFMGGFYLVKKNLMKKQQSFLQHIQQK